MIKPRKTVFLDRDGVLNRRLVGDYVTCLEELEMLPGVPEAVSRLNRIGYRTVVVTNQRGIALGRMTHEMVDQVHNFIRERVAALGGCLEEFYVCPHDRDEGCGCRKPAAGLLDQAHTFYPVDWPASFLIGDSDSDIQAGQARDLATIKVSGPSVVGADFEQSDLPAAARLIGSLDVSNSA